MYQLSKKYCFLKRKLFFRVGYSDDFVAVSNSETTAKATDVRVKGQRVMWSQKLDAL